MVNITRTDLGLLLSMFLLVWVLSQFFALAGLADDSFDASDPPTLNLSDTDVDVVPDPGNPPLGANQYRISYSTDESFPRLLDLNESSTIEVNDCDIFTGYDDCAWNYRLQLSGNIPDETNLTGNGSVGVVEYQSAAESWRLKLELEDNRTGQTVVTVEESVGESGFINTLVATAESAYNAIASAIGTIANLIHSLFAQTINTLLQLVVLSTRVGGFAVDYLGYTFGGYLAVTTSARAGWATPILVLPLIVLSFEMFKIGLATIKSVDPLIPFT